MATARYVVRECIWMMHCTLQLLAALSTGIYWIVQMIRLILYSMSMLHYFIPHIWWYLTSPSVIRRVTYRYTPQPRRTRLPRSSPPVRSQSRTTGTASPGRRGQHSDVVPPALDDESCSSLADGGVRTPLAQSPAYRPTRQDTPPRNGCPRGMSSGAALRTASSADSFRAYFQREKTKSSTTTALPHGIHPNTLRLSSYGASGVTPSRITMPFTPARMRESKCTEADGLQYEDSDDYFDEEYSDTELQQAEANNRATLDIYLPVPLDVVMMSLDYSHRNHRLRRKKFPVAILVTGAAWIIGSQLWSSMLARVLASRGYVVFCPDYRNFPQTDLEGMTLDVSDAISWVLRNAGRYNGDLDDVTLVGQSAGAHLTMMSLLSQAHLAGYEAKGGKRSGLPPPSDVAYNVPRYVPRQAIHRYVGLSGIYNLEKQLPHLHQKGLNRALLYKIAGGKENLPRYSINWYFDPKRLGETGEVLPDNIFDFMPQRMFFLHGDADETSPLEDCASLVLTLRSAQCAFQVERDRALRERRQHVAQAMRLVPGVLSSASSSSDSDDKEEGRETIDLVVEPCSSGAEETGQTSSGAESQCSALRHRPHPSRTAPNTSSLREPGSTHKICGEVGATSRSAWGVRTEGKVRLPPVGDALNSGTGVSPPTERWRSVTARPNTRALLDLSAAPPPPAHSLLAVNARPPLHVVFPASLGSRGRQRIASPLPPVLREPIVCASAPFYPDPQPECRLGFISIPGAHHTDALVEECLSAGRSCCADFLCDYDEEEGVDRHERDVVSRLCLTADRGRSRSALRSPPPPPLTNPVESPFRRFITREFFQPARGDQRCAVPDGLLPLAVPPEERGILMRWCSSLCPF